MYMTRDRERGVDFSDLMMDSGTIRDVEPLEQVSGGSSGRSRYSSRKTLKRERSLNKIRAVTKSINFVQDEKKRQHVNQRFSQRNPQRNSQRSSSMDDIRDMVGTSGFFDNLLKRETEPTGKVIEGTGKPFPLVGRPREDGNWGELFDLWDKETSGDGKRRATFFDPNNPDNIDRTGFASTQGGRTPPLFLQELAHLSSLLVAVALSTLRNDIDGAESPLAFYEPGCPWPETDPDKDEKLRATGIISPLRAAATFLGMGRSPAEQTRYNAGRPLPVIGGVSDGEIRFLQMARGPYAKTQLCWNWLSEFCIREHLAGSMGNVGPPIISRVIQFLGDGMIYYNHARKIMYIPFPFVHAQLSVMFILAIVPCIPLVMDQYIIQTWIGAVLTFFTVMCLSGTHEVARELENPFRNVPNELPLVTFMAHYNEALITMYSGYHPDHFWDGERILRKRGGIDRRSVSENGGHGSGRKTSEPAQERGNHREEIAALKEQLEAQAVLIQELAAKVNFSPDHALRTVEEMADNCIAKGEENASRWSSSPSI